jgi:hypothetical protein
MNFRSQRFLFPSILVILGTASFSPELKAQDLNNFKPITTPSQTTPQQGTEVNRSKPTIETQSSQESATPAPTNCQGKTPSAGQPSVPSPTGSMSTPESKIPKASELMTPLEEKTDPLNPSSPVPQSQPTSPSR